MKIDLIRSLLFGFSVAVLSCSDGDISSNTKQNGAKIEYEITMRQGAAGVCLNPIPMTTLTSAWAAYEEVAEQDVRSRCRTQARLRCQSTGGANSAVYKKCDSAVVTVKTRQAVVVPHVPSKPTTPTTFVCRGMVKDSTGAGLFRGDIVKTGASCKQACAAVHSQVILETQAIKLDPVKKSWYPLPWAVTIKCDVSSEGQMLYQITN